MTTAVPDPEANRYLSLPATTIAGPPRSRLAALTASLDALRVEAAHERERRIAVEQRANRLAERGRNLRDALLAITKAHSGEYAWSHSKAARAKQAAAHYLADKALQDFAPEYEHLGLDKPVEQSAGTEATT